MTRPRLGPTIVWFEVLVVASLSVWLGMVGLTVLLRAHDLLKALATARGNMVSPVLFAVILAIVVLERRWPAVRRPLMARAHVVDAGYLALYAVAVVPLLMLVQTGFAVEVDRHARFLVLDRIPLVPRLAIVGAVLLGTDAMNWAAHVANHRSAPLWRIHALHHSQEDMSVMTTFRTHPLMHAAYLPAMIPALILGASGSMPASALVLYGCLVTLPHANLKWGFGPLGRVFVSPAYHRLHHSSEPVAGRPAVNFGFVLVCWDRLAGQAVFPTGPDQVATGLAGRPVPVEQDPGTGLLRVVASQLVQPFRLRAATDVTP